MGNLQLQPCVQPLSICIDIICLRDSDWGNVKVSAIKLLKGLNEESTYTIFNFYVALYKFEKFSIVDVLYF